MESNEMRYWKALKRMSKYMTPAQIRRDSGMGLDYREYLEMAYENLREEAIIAIRRRKPPKE